MSNGEKPDVYIETLYLKEAGIWEEYQWIYNNNFDYEKLEMLKKSISLDEEKCKNFLNTLNTLFQYYKVNKKII